MARSRPRPVLRKAMRCSVVKVGFPSPYRRKKRKGKENNRPVFLSGWGIMNLNCNVPISNTFAMTPHYCYYHCYYY